MVWEEDNSPGSVVERAVQEVGMFDFRSCVDGLLWAGWRWSSWLLGALRTRVRHASGVLWRIAEIGCCVPVLSLRAERIVSHSIEALQEHSAIGWMRQLRGVSAVLVNWATVIATLTSDQSDQYDCQNKELHLFSLDRNFISLQNANNQLSAPLERADIY